MTVLKAHTCATVKSRRPVLPSVESDSQTLRQEPEACCRTVVSINCWNQSSYTTGTQQPLTLAQPPVKRPNRRPNAKCPLGTAADPICPTDPDAMCIYGLFTSYNTQIKCLSKN